MRKTLLILLFFISVLIGYSQPRQSSFTWLRAEDITNTRYFIWQGDTIDFSAFVDSIYVNYADTVTMLATQYWIDSLGVMKSDSTILYVTPEQLRDSLAATISHDAVTLNSTATTGGLTLSGQKISFQPATASQNGYLKKEDWSNFNSKIATVSHNETMTGLGTSASPLKVDTTEIATKYYVDTYGGGSGTVIGPASAENLNIAVFDGTSGDTIADGTYTIAEILNLGNATGTLSEANIDSDIARDSEIPEISDIAYDATTWDGNTDGATKNALRDKFESLSGGHDPVTIGTANGLSLSTQELSLGLASTSSTGALSNTDWDIFNGKQDALTTGDLTENITGLEFDNTRQVIGGAAQLSLSSGYVIPSATDTTRWGQGGSFTETDPVYTGDSANIVWFPDLEGLRDTIGIFSDSITNYDLRLLDIEGIDTTGTYHINRALLDAISANDTTRWGQDSEMVYPSAGIPLSTGTAWGTSVTNNSSNWNTSYDWGYTAAIIKNQSAISIFQYPHSAIVVNDTMFLGERKADPYIIRFNDPDDLTDYNRQAITGTGSSSGGLESVCYDETNDRLYFGIQDAPNGALKIVEVDPSNLSGYSIHTISGLSTYYTPPICTDGSYIYGATAVSSGTKLFKINIATWDTVKTVSWANGYQAHSCQINTSRNEFYIANSGAGTMYMAKVSTSDLSHSDVNISSYVAYGTDDIAFYDDGTTCNVFIVGESKVGNYGGVMVTTTDGNSLTGIDLKPSYGLFEFDNVIYVCGLQGYVQAFSVFNPTDVSTFVVDKLTPTEVLKTSSGQTFITDWKAASSCRLYEFHVPVSIPTTNISGVTSITEGTAIDITSSIGDVTISTDLSELSYDGTITTENGYLIWSKTTGTSHRATVGAVGLQIFPNGQSYTSDLNNIAKSGVYYAYTGSTNKPGTTNGYVSHLQWADNSGFAKQTFVEYNSDVLYMRRKENGTWQNWVSIGGSGGDMYKSVYDANEDNVIDVIRGGTGQSGYTIGDILYANSTVTLAKLNAGTSGYVLTSNGAGSAPSWQAAGGGSTTFIGLTDTPDSYSGQAGKYLKVNTGATALEFTDAPSGGGVTSVAAGNGMDFTTITSTGSVTLGTPSSITTSSTNSLTATSHTHTLDLSGRSVLTQYSLTGGGNLGSDRTINLVGDVASPGNSKYYGTNSGGTRGFYDLPSGSGPNLTVQTLSGKTPAWNLSNGVNAKITLSGNTTITLSNATSGYSGNLTVTNASAAYTITFSGYTNKIAPTLDASSGAITMSGGSNIDILSWYYDGTYIIINGTFGYE